tara:strand:- start:13291 stop:14556 length:1266 start_codon:yes stop_codon:yes gene_type:complete
MKKSVKIRKIIFEILYEIYQKNSSFDESFVNFTSSLKLNEQEKSMVYNITLNSLRKRFYIANILNDFLKKKTSIKIKILLISAITQILYLDFKTYAVTNETVEVAKIKKLNPGLVNSLLKNLCKNLLSINKEKIDFDSVPYWFSKRLKQNKLSIKTIIKNTSVEPSLHLVFKNKKLLNCFSEPHIKTTDKSAFVLEKKKIDKYENYSNGHWWIQDFASMLPIFLSNELHSKKTIDMCAAPGGKAFQLLSSGSEVFLNDINSKRINLLNENLNRLNFTKKLSNINALDLPENQNYEVVVLDSPCTGIGTIRRNPEILFKKKAPDIEKLSKIQENLINKASQLLKKNGVLIYMVCSFFVEETKEIKKKFLEKNKNFSQLKFRLKNKHNLNNFIDKDGDYMCIPTKYKNYMIDGFYAVKFQKND